MDAPAPAAGAKRKRSEFEGGGRRRPAWCPHDHRPDYCRDCGGKYSCEHNNNRFHCGVCLPAKAKLASGRWCVVCLVKQIRPAINSTGMCRACKVGLAAITALLGEVGDVAPEGGAGVSLK